MSFQVRVLNDLGDAFKDLLRQEVERACLYCGRQLKCPIKIDLIC